MCATMPNAVCLSTMKDGAHRDGKCDPLTLLGRRLAASLGGERVISSGTSGLALAPIRLEPPGALHLMERGVDRSFLHLELAGASALRFLEYLIAVHRPLAQEREDEEPHSPAKEFTIVVHDYLVCQVIVP